MLVIFRLDVYITLGLIVISFFTSLTGSASSNFIKLMPELLLLLISLYDSNSLSRDAVRSASKQSSDELTGLAFISYISLLLVLLSSSALAPRSISI
jgi:hypothetical protein